jgi:Serine dehydrogenase proteinase
MTGIRCNIPNDVLDLMKLYPQPTRAQSGGGGVYLPMPRQKEAVSREA